MGISNCKHHYVLASPNGMWAIAVCKKCRMKTAFRNSLDWDIHKRILEKNFITKFEFLESQNIPIKELIPSDKKEWILPYVEKYGIQGTARKLKLPVSSVGMWAKGKSGMPRNADKYSPSFKKKVLQKIEDNQPHYSIAKEFDMPRTTVQSWANNVKNTPKDTYLNSSNGTNTPLTQ